MFTHDSRTENFLNQMGVKSEYHDTIEMSELHRDWRISNLGRPNAITDDAVQEYALLGESGSPAPACILIMQQGGYAVLDGVQRISAEELMGGTRIGAYVLNVRTSISKQHMIRIYANPRINGQHTPDKCWLLEQAVAVLYYADNCSAEEISKAIGAHLPRVREEIRVQKNLKHILSTGYDGRMTDRRRSRWFLSEIGKYAEESDWQCAPGPLKAIVETVEECKFKNGDISHLLKKCFDINRSVKKDRFAQFQSKLKELKQSPEVRERLQRGNKKSKNVDKILQAMRALSTILANAVEGGEVIHDTEFANVLATILKDIYVSLKKLTPRDIQFSGGHHSSIYDKG